MAVFVFTVSFLYFNVYSIGTTTSLLDMFENTLAVLILIQSALTMLFQTYKTIVHLYLLKSTKAL